MNRQLLAVLKFAGFLSIGIVILALVFRSQNEAFQAQCALDGVAPENCSLLHKLADDLSHVRYGWLGILLLIFMLSNFFRAWRWQQLIEPLGKKVSFWNSFWTIMVGYFANLGLPRMGELVRAGMLGRYEGIKVEKVMGTVVIDRLLDVLCLLCVIGLAFLLEWDTLYGFISGARSGSDVGSPPGFLQRLAGYWPWFLGILLTLGLLAAFFYRRVLDSSIGRRIVGILRGFADGLRSVLKVRNLPLLVFNTLAIWVCYFLMAWLPFFSFPATEHLGPDAALMVFVFSALGIVIPSPGGLGSYHLMVIQALALYGIAGDDALSFANILFFTVNLFCNIVFGLLGLFVLPLLNKGRRIQIGKAAEPERNAQPEAV